MGNDTNKNPANKWLMIPIISINPSTAPKPKPYYFLCDSTNELSSHLMPTTPTVKPFQ